MSKLAKFWRLFESVSSDDTSSLSSFAAALASGSSNARKKSGSTERPFLNRWRALYGALRGCDGWGPKTSALFVKNVINVHRGPSKFHFWARAQAGAVNVSTPKGDVGAIASRAGAFVRLVDGREFDPPVRDAAAA